MAAHFGESVEKGKTGTACGRIGAGVTQGQIGQGRRLVRAERGKMIGQRRVAEFFPRMQIRVADRFIVERDAKERAVARTARGAGRIGSGLQRVMMRPDFHGRRKARARRSPNAACNAAAWARSWLVSRAGGALRQAQASHQARGMVRSGRRKAQR